MKQETLDAMRAWLDGETLEYRDMGTFPEWKIVVPHSECEGLPFLFDDSDEYRIKPRTIRIGEHDVPMPVSETPLYGQKYYMPSVTSEDLVSTREWIKHSIDRRLLSSGLIHLNREAAELHAKALISLTEVKL